MADEVERIDELREQLDMDVQAFEHARASVRPSSGSDEHGVITVDIDPDGLVDAVSARPDWGRFYEPEQLASAVLAAYASAGAARSQVYAEALADDDEPAVRRPADQAPRAMGFDVLDRIKDHELDLPPSMLQALSDLLDDLDQGLDRALDMVDDQLSATSTGRSVSGHVRAEVSGAGMLVGVTYDERWLESAHHTNVGRETTDAVHQAYRLRATQSVADITEASGMARVRDITATADTLARHLGI